MARIRFIPYQGFQIYYQDLSGAQNRAEAVEIIQESIATAGRQRPRSLYTITNVAGSYFDHEVLKWVRRAVKHNEGFILFEAVIGMSAMQRLVFNGFRAYSKRTYYVAKDMEDAKRWLAAQYRAHRP